MTMELKEAEQDIINEFTSSLCDLVVNSRPMIQMLTMLADDHSALAPAIVAAIEKRLLQVKNWTVHYFCLNRILIYFSTLFSLILIDLNDLFYF
jgi:hypothetical protein